MIHKIGKSTCLSSQNPDDPSLKIPGASPGWAHASPHPIPPEAMLRRQPTSLRKSEAYQNSGCHKCSSKHTSSWRFLTILGEAVYHAGSYP